MRKQFLRLVPGVHRVMDNHPVARCLRRQLKNPLIMVYYHLRNRVWVIASWVSKRYALVIEHVPFGGTSGFTEEVAMECARQQLSMDVDRQLQELREKAWREGSDTYEQMQAEDDEHLDFREWMRRRAKAHWRDHPVWNYW